MTTAEQLALAVLKGDKDAIRALHDCLAEDFAPNGEAKELIPVTRKITVPLNRLRVVVYLKEEDELTEREVGAINNSIRWWLNWQIPCLIDKHISRVEIYELPENFLPTQEQLEAQYPARVMEYTGDGLAHNVLTPEQFREMIDSSEPQG